MEKAILKTLIYADIFDYPLTIFEIHKWLIGKKATLRQVESGIGRLVKSSKLKVKSEYYFLPKKQQLVLKRKRREKQSAIYLRKAKLLSQILKIVPWIKLVGISGGLAMENAAKSDDIDLFLVTGQNRLWLSRILALGLLSLTGQRRKNSDTQREIAGKLCLNILLEDDKLTQSSQDLYIAHEVLQMKVLWQRDGIYSKYLLDNEWVFKFLPNWVGEEVVSSKYYILGEKKKKPTSYPLHVAINFIEVLAWKFQLWYMKSPQGLERIGQGEVYFHPNDVRPKILKEYAKRIKT